MSEPVQNPFEAPASEARELPVIVPGQIDISAAVAAGWAATKRNFWVWTASIIVGYVLFILAEVTIVGIFLLWPVLMWGWFYFALRAHDGVATFGDGFAGFQQYGQALGSMLGLGALYFALFLPGGAVMFAAMFAGMVDPEGPGMAALSAGYLVLIVWSLAVGTRFAFAPFFVVDRGMGPVEAMKASWAVTANQKLNVVLLIVINYLLTLLGALLLLVGMLPATMTGFGAFTAAYRQLAGPRR